MSDAPAKPARRGADVGRIKFKARRAANMKEPVRFVRVSAGSLEPGLLAKPLYDLMLKAWRMQPPSLLISVTGAAGGDIEMATPKHFNRFSDGLMGAALSTDAWIFTGGMEAGIMQTVGKMQAAWGSPTPCIGVASWGCVKNRDMLQEKDTTSHAGPVLEEPIFEYDNEESDDAGAFLDPNHTHFLLVDTDDPPPSWGKEIALRNALEAHVVHNCDAAPASKTAGSASGGATSEGEAETAHQKIPSLLIVYSGGPGTIDTTLGAGTASHAYILCSLYRTLPYRTHHTVLSPPYSL
jgi:hypothetical protein